MKTIIEYKNISKSYKKNLALDNVSFKIEKNMINVLIGENGAGKTTTVKIMLGLQFPNKGKVEYLSDKYSYKSGNKNVGFLPEVSFVLPKITIYDYLYAFAKERDVPSNVFEERITGIFNALNLKCKMNSKLKNLSKGMMQKVNIAQAFLHDPELIILDEPTSGLDPLSRQALFNLLNEYKKQGKTFIITTHNLDEIDEIADRIIVFNKGHILKECFTEDISQGKRHLIVETNQDLSHDFECKKINDNEYLITYPEDQSLNLILDDFIKSGIELTSIQTKSFDLKGYYMSLIKEAENEKSI